MPNFMEPQITRHQNWLRVETTEGTEWVSIADTSLFVRNSETVTHPMTDQERTETVNKIRPFVNGEPQDWENVMGYGVRLSAPGYLDCTEWAVFETEDEARKYLEEMDEDEPE